MRKEMLFSLTRRLHIASWWKKNAGYESNVGFSISILRCIQHLLFRVKCLKNVFYIGGAWLTPMLN